MKPTPTKDNAHGQVGEVKNQCRRHQNAISPAARRQPLKGIKAYERVRADWIAANPEHTERELLEACVIFARVCGLILREQVLMLQLSEVSQ